METPLPHPHGFGPLAFQWWSFSATWHFMKCLSRAAPVALVTAGPCLCTHCEDTSDTDSGERRYQGSHHSVLCILHFLSGTVRANALTWDWSAAGSSTDVRQHPPLSKGRASAAAMSQSLERDRIKGHLQSHSLPSVVERGHYSDVLGVDKTNSGVGQDPGKQPRWPGCHQCGSPSARWLLSQS